MAFVLPIKVAVISYPHTGHFISLGIIVVIKFLLFMFLIYIRFNKFMLMEIYNCFVIIYIGFLKIFHIIKFLFLLNKKDYFLFFLFLRTILTYFLFLMIKKSYFLI